jgi:hypothetical protein
MENWFILHIHFHLDLFSRNLIKCPLFLVWNQVELGRTGVNTNPGVILLSVSHL